MAPNPVIEKKKISKLKGKKKWAKQLDASNIQVKMEKKHNKKLQQEQLKKAAVVSFDISTEQDNNQRKPLSKDRFKKQSNEHNMNPKTLRRLEKKGKNLKKEAQRLSNQQPTNQDSDDDELWEQQQQQQQEQEKEQKIKRVIVPTDGLSYNPSAQAYENLQEELVVDEMEKDKILLNSSVEKKNNIVLKKKQILSKNPKMRYEQEQALKRKQEKLIAHQILTIKNIKKELNKEEQEKETKRKQKELEQQLETEKQNALGIIAKGQGKRISNKKYEFQKPIVKESDIPDKLSTINSNDQLIRDQMDSVYRRGHLEQRRKTRQRTSRVDPRKVYGTNRGMTEDDKWMMDIE